MAKDKTIRLEQVRIVGANERYVVGQKSQDRFGGVEDRTLDQILLMPGGTILLRYATGPDEVLRNCPIVGRVLVEPEADDAADSGPDDSSDPARPADDADPNEPASPLE